MNSRPLVARFGVYLRERFSPVQFVLLSIIVALPAAAGGAALVRQPLLPYLPPLAGAALFLFLLRLRLFDEIKDHAHDRTHYPERPVPRGLISLREVRMLIWLTLAAEGLIAASVDPIARLAFLIALAYSLLAAQEFFVSTWLRAHFTTYIISHELLVVPLVWYIILLSTPRLELLDSVSAWALALFLCAGIFLLEIARKMRAPEDENASRDTYSSQYGPSGSALLAGTVSLAMLGAFFFLDPLVIYAFCALCLWFFFAVSLYPFSRHATRRLSRRVFRTAILFVVALNGLLFFQFLI